MSMASARPAEDPEAHPSREQLARFLRGELSEEVRSTILRHLLARCPQCLPVTGRMWAQASGKVPAPKRRRRTSGGVPVSAAARAALESAAQERLLELAGVLQEVGQALKGIAEALPPPHLPMDEESVTVELRALIDCVLTDLIRPAIESLRAAASFPTAPPPYG